MKFHKSVADKLRHSFKVRINIKHPPQFGFYGTDKFPDHSTKGSTITITKTKHIL